MPKDTQTKTAVLYRMVMPEHTCSYGLKSKDLLEHEGFEVEDHYLETREETSYQPIIALFIGTVGAVSVFKAVYVNKRELKCACVGGDQRAAGLRVADRKPHDGRHGHRDLRLMPVVQPRRGHLEAGSPVR